MQLKHPLPDFARMQWVSSMARSIWEPRVAAIVKQFAAAERASVGKIRAAALQNISPEQFPELAQRAAKIGLCANPIGVQGVSESYAASVIDAKESEPWEYRVAITMPATARPFLEAWEKKDDETLGRLLGYPSCCSEFFLKTWASGSVDPTWQMADRGDGPIEANILLRWLCVRYVPHLPCGFKCDATVNFGRKLRSQIPKRERAWMDSLLSMPMLWTSLNGIGELVTPIVTLNFRSDVSNKLLEIRREGSSYPEAGAQAIRFPYRPAPAGRADECLWIDNGFSSRMAMEAGHEMIVSILKEHLAAGWVGSTIIDLGAGNGELLRKLGLNRVVGIESDSRRVARRVWKGIRLGRIQDVEEIFPGQGFAVAMISMRRFEEMTEEETEKLRAWLERSVDRVLVYQYEQPQFARIIFPREIAK